VSDGRTLTLSAVEGVFAVARLAPDQDPPGWAVEGPFASVTRTADEMSVVCLEDHVPAGVLYEGGWRCLGVVGQLDFSLAGVIASLAGPLAGAGVPIFVISTYDSDYLLVKDDRLERAVAALSEAGHTVRR
jgi:uncharacterized protein